MSYSLLSLAGDTKNNAMKGLRDAANMETQRENMNEKLKTAEKTSKMSAIGSGAAIAAMAGAGPVGIAVGAGAGLLVGGLF